MTTLTVPATPTDGQVISAADWNDDMSAIVDYVNNNVIKKDASTAFTTIPTGPNTDPSSDNQFARKKYVDTRTRGVVALREHFTNSFASDATSDGNASGVSTTFTMPDLANGQHLQVSVFVPQFTVSGSVVPGRAMALRVSTGSKLVCFGQSIVDQAAALLPTDGPSLYVERTFSSNTDFGSVAGASVTLTIFLRLQGGGTFVMSGSTDAPVQLKVEVL